MQSSPTFMALLIAQNRVLTSEVRIFFLCACIAYLKIRHEPKLVQNLTRAQFHRAAMQKILLNNFILY